MLEKPGAENIAAFENQGKQHKLSDQWKSVKMSLKKNSRMLQKDKKIDWKISFNKRFHILQN